MGEDGLFYRTVSPRIRAMGFLLVRQGHAGILGGGCGKSLVRERCARTRPVSGYGNGYYKLLMRSGREAR